MLFLCFHFLFDLSKNSRLFRLLLLWFVLRSSCHCCSCCCWMCSSSSSPISCRHRISSGSTDSWRCCRPSIGLTIALSRGLSISEHAFTILSVLNLIAWIGIIVSVVVARWNCGGKTRIQWIFHLLFLHSLCEFLLLSIIIFKRRIRFLQMLNVFLLAHRRRLHHGRLRVVFRRLLRTWPCSCVLCFLSWARDNWRSRTRTCCCCYYRYRSWSRSLSRFRRIRLRIGLLRRRLGKTLLLLRSVSTSRFNRRKQVLDILIRWIDILSSLQVENG